MGNTVCVIISDDTVYTKNILDKLTILVTFQDLAHRCTLRRAEELNPGVSHL